MPTGLWYNKDVGRHWKAMDNKTQDIANINARRASDILEQHGVSIDAIKAIRKLIFHTHDDIKTAMEGNNSERTTNE